MGSRPVVVHLTSVLGSEVNVVTGAVIEQANEDIGKLGSYAFRLSSGKSRVAKAVFPVCLKSFADFAMQEGNLISEGTIVGPAFFEDKLADFLLGSVYRGSEDMFI